MKKFEVIVFDIDGTLTRSKLQIDDEMSGLFCQLLEKYIVAIISGAGYEQFKWQILEHLRCVPETLQNLFLLPVDGTVFCTYKDGWQCESDPPLSSDDKDHIKNAFENIFAKAGLETPKKFYGELIEDRGAQLNFSAFGQDAPLELKESWDIDTRKRGQIIDVLKEALPDFSMRIGGTTSIEVTRQGIDKAYGLNKLLRKLNISNENMLYVGDKLALGGNDAPALSVAGECRAVKNLEETKEVIQALLK